ncbi:MAG: hypothetical protein AB7G39_09755 [Alphaproteobacteria bacterium]
MRRLAGLAAALTVAWPAFAATLEPPAGERLDAAALVALYAHGFHAEGSGPRLGPVVFDLLPDGRMLVDGPFGEWHWRLEDDSFCIARSMLGIAREYCMIVYRTGDGQYDAYFAMREPDAPQRVPGRKNLSFTLRP